MSTVATLPRAGGNGAALVVVVADLLMRAFAALTAKATREVKTTPNKTQPAAKVNLRQLYRLAGDRDSVNPIIWSKLN